MICIFSKILKTFVFIFLLFTCTVFAQNNRIRFDYLTVDNGLSSNHTRVVYQDKKGFLWIATEEGLNRYDGYNFKYYKHDPKNINSLSDNAVNALVEDESGLFWIATRNGLNVFDPVQEKFKHFKFSQDNPGSISTDKLTYITADSSGNIWIASREGLNLYNKSKNTFKVFKNNPDQRNSLSHNYVTAVFVDHSGNLWAGTKNGLNKFNYKDSTFYSFYSDPDNPESLSNSFINCIYEDSKKNIWIGTRLGINKLLWQDENSAGFIAFKNESANDNSLSNNNVKTICEDENQNLWIGTIGGGISIYNSVSNAFVQVQHNPETTQSLSDDIIIDIIKANSGIMWVATLSKGLNKYNPAKERFIHYQPNSNTQVQIIDNDISAVLIDRDNNLWLGTNGNGITLIEDILGGKNIESIKKILFRNEGTNSLSNNYVTSIIQDEDGIMWIGTFGGGLNRYDSNSKRFTVYKHDKNNLNSISNNYIQSIYEDELGFLWIGTGLGGVCKFDKSTGAFTCFNYNPKDVGNNKNPSAVEVTSIFEDSEGYLWFGTSTGGLNKFNTATQVFTYYNHDPEDTTSISSNRIVTIYEDSKARLWIGTFSAGLNLFDRDSELFIHFTETGGLSGNTVTAITEDNAGNLWISTSKGISRFNPETKQFRKYDGSDGLQGNEFNANSVFNDFKNNRILFGGANGLNIFYPDILTDNSILPEIVITDFKLFNQSVAISDTSVLDSSIIFKDEIILSHDQNTIAFEFSALHFMNPAKNLYAYKMEGIDRNWIFAGRKRYAEYTNLSPGDYTFKVKGSNGDGVWNEAATSIKIIIKPPFWKTWWAYSIYLILIVAGFLAIRRYEINRVKLRNELRLKEFESLKLQEVDQIKSRFFANLSHEFRTPLTIILGTLEKVKRQMKDNPSEEEFTVMKRNASRLLQLINQLLELSRIEAGSVKLNLAEVDIIKFLKRITASFTSLAYQKSLKIFFNSVPIENAHPETELKLYFDKKKLETVFYNLLSNAIKFTPNEGTIEISISDKVEFIEITVANSGIEIPPDQLTKIFDRFYQVDDSGTRNFEGTGIGLSLVKEYVELHKGSIKASSSKIKTTFTISLPTTKFHESISESEDEAENFQFDPDLRKLGNEVLSDSKDSERSAGGEDKTVILIVEDNSDLRDMIKENLQNDYSVLEAEDGKKGLELAELSIPDLIISDIMMPEMDGNELSRRIKANEKTNHIPVILLTAKADTKDKLEGLETGADDYLIKPFNEEELRLRIRNLINIRQRMREKYQSHMLIKPDDVTVPSTQKVFIVKLTGIIETNMSNENFSVEILCDEIGMSRSQLHRKIKAITNQSTTEFIRNFRLQRAAELLKQDAGNIAEICYMVGFNSQNYFTKMFQTLFGKTPLEYKKEHTK